MAVFGIVLMCLSVAFWIERAMKQTGRATIDKKTPLHFGSNTPFKVLLADAGDFDLVNGTFVKIGDRYGHWVDATRYAEEERAIMLVWHSSGIIDNGGFEYLFSGDFDGDPEFKITAETYKVVGLTRGYEAFQEAFRQFPNGKVPYDSEERIRQYKLADESVREEINRKHWQDGWDDLREKKLAEFIRVNLAKLGKLD